tara:strand:- start:204 stop:389 length:186 start_codon:yes stop_codon:yes gene_type:complete
MQFQKKTSTGFKGTFIKLFIKLILIIVVLFIGVVLVDRIDFPSPNKIIEKVIPNENLKIVK